jgi:hypothetical protein
MHSLFETDLEFEGQADGGKSQENIRRYTTYSYRSNVRTIRNERHVQRK